jgi:probable addiction module antidote protein
MSDVQDDAKLTTWDAADYLRSEEAIAEYITAALEEGDAKLAAAALGDVARARGMTGVARESGLAREALYRALSEEGNPAFDTILRVAKALGVRLVAAPAAHQSPPATTP